MGRGTREVVEGAALRSADGAERPLDLEFANEMLTGVGQAVDKAALRR